MDADARFVGVVVGVASDRIRAAEFIVRDDDHRNDDDIDIDDVDDVPRGRTRTTTTMGDDDDDFWCVVRVRHVDAPRARRVDE